MMGTVTYQPPAQPQRGLGTATQQIDQFYDWIYQRGLERFAAQGTTPQMLYRALHQEGRR